jgi:hypothetical protein
MKVLFRITILCSAIILLSTSIVAQTCQMAGDVDQASKTSLDNAAAQYLASLASGNTQALAAVATPEFPNVTAVADEAKANLAGATGKVRWYFLLDNTQGKAGERAEFYCGVFNSQDRISFSFSQLPPARFGVVVQDTTGGKVPYMITWILQNSNAQWRIAGLIPKPATIAGKTGLEFWKEARAGKTAGKLHNAYFEYVMADYLLRPTNLMSTPNLDKLADELQQATPNDVPTNGPITMQGANGKGYQVTQIFPTPVDDKLDLVVKYSVPDVSNTPQVFQDNTAVIKAVVTKWPEVRDLFNAIVARATPPSGQDYGTLLEMKDIK